eukprot:tig00000459_g1066.t1
MASSGGSNAADAPSQPWKARLFGSATIAGPEHNGPAHGVLIVFRGGPPSTREALVRRAKEEGLIRDEPGDVVVARWQPRLDRFDIVTKNTRFECEDEEPCFVLEPRGERLCASTYRLRPAAEAAGVGGGTPARARAASGSVSGAKRPREDDDEERSEPEPEEEVAAGGSALEQLPDDVILRIMEFMDVVGACRMRAASRRLRALVAGRMPPLREALLDLTGFTQPVNVMYRLLRHMGDDPDGGPEVACLLSSPELRVCVQDATEFLESYIGDLVKRRVARGVPLRSLQLSAQAEMEAEAARRLFTLATSAFGEAEASLEALRFELAGRPPYDRRIYEPGLFRPFAKLRALALPHFLPVVSWVAADIAASLPSLKTLELSPEDAPALSALAPLALERLAIFGHAEIDEDLSKGLADLCKGPASASLRVLSFRPPPSTPSSEVDPFDPPPAVTLSGSAARAISGFANLERVEGYIRFKLKPAKRQSRFQRRANSDNDERRPSDAVHVASLARMPKMTSLQVRLDLEWRSAWRHVLEGLAEGARANPALRLDLSFSAQLQGPDPEDEATAGDPSGAVEALIEAAPDSLRHVAFAWPAPLHGGVAAALARLGPGTRSLRLAHAVDSLRELRAYRAFQGMARPSPAFAFGVHVAAPRRGLLEMARADLEVYLPPFATRSFSLIRAELP